MPERAPSTALPRFTRPLLHPLVLTALVGLASAQDGRRADDETLEELAGHVGRYLAARSSGSDVQPARAELAASLERLGTALEVPAPLALAPDIGRALWLSRDYADRKLRLGKVTDEGPSGPGAVGYAYRVPDEYDPEVRAYPLIVSIPDAGEAPAHNLRSRWQSREVLDEAILVSPGMPEERDEWEPLWVEGRAGGRRIVLTVLRLARERFAVDFDRVYVVGHGHGVPTAVAVGHHAPQDLAGVAGRAGDAGQLGPENFSNLPTWFSGGGARARAFQEGAPEGLCRLSPAGDENELWQWILEHPRRPLPTEVTLVAGKPYPTRAYWLRIAPSAPEARATATLDRDQNTVSVQATGVSHVTLYVNDRLLDLDEPVHVVCNEAETSLVIPRRLPDTLDMLYDGTSDPACVYVGSVVVDAADASTPALDSPARDEELARRLDEAGDDVEALWGLVQECRESGREVDVAPILLRIVRLDADHARARESLGHVAAELADETVWFPSPAALARFQEAQAPGEAEARGLVEHDGLWIHADERTFANKGWTKDVATGTWLSGADRKRLAEGWVRQDLLWIPPEEAHLVDAGLWRVEGEWMTMARADERHARIETPWRIPSPEVHLVSTADRRVSLLALEAMAGAVRDLRRVFGTEPRLPLRVGLFRDEEQYDRFATGDPAGRLPAAGAGRLHLIHSAFFAESWFPWIEGEREFRGMGVGLWDTLVPHGDLYGYHSARLALGLSYVDALDPSPKAVRRARKNGPDEGYFEAYQEEKRLPAWLRAGAAVYAERYFEDPRVEEGGDAFWARTWSLENLRAKGGLRPLPEVFAFELDPDDREDGQRLLLEAGLLVAFVVDGGCAPVAEEHRDFQRALAAGRLHENLGRDLAEVIAAHETELRAFAGE